MAEYVDREKLLKRIKASPLFDNPKDHAFLKFIKLGVIDLIERQPATVVDNEEHCVCCGEVIPEGRQVCPKCERSVDDG